MLVGKWQRALREKNLQSRKHSEYGVNMISAKSRKLLSESRQRIIAVTTNLFNSSCTSLFFFVRFIYSIPFNLLNVRCTFSFFTAVFRFGIAVQFHSARLNARLHGSFTRAESTLVDFIRNIT